MAKNIVIMSDGTGNEPKLEGNTNVMRLFEMLEQNADQVAWYDPGVGTEDSVRGLTPVGRTTTRLAGLAFGYGIKENVSEAYRYLMNTYEPGDRIYLFGFSRGAYTVRALAALIYQVGLLRKGQDNLVPNGLKLVWWRADRKKKEAAVWREADRFSNKFSRPDFQRRRDGAIHYVGVWDTVKAVGIARRELVLPWTAKMPMAAALSHAVSIDEKRRPYKPNLLAFAAPGKLRGDFKEVWFAGVHSDVGGTFKRHELADISFAWLVGDAVERGLIVHEPAFKEFQDQHVSLASGPVHDMGWRWWVTTLFYRRAIVPHDAMVHQSVDVRMHRDPDYRPELPESVRWETWPHLE